MWSFRTEPDSKLAALGVVEPFAQLSDRDLAFVGSTDEIARLGPGSIIGEIAAVDRVPRTASVIANSDVALALFDVRSLQRTWQPSPRSTKLADARGGNGGA